jgi:hypothetical protein
MKWLSGRVVPAAALAVALLPVCHAQYLATTVSVGTVGTTPCAATTALTYPLSATVTAGSTVVNSGTVWFTVLGARIPAAVNSGLATACVPVPAAMPGGTYPVTATYAPDDSVHITNFTKTNNIYNQLNQQFPNTGGGTLGTPTGIPNATFLYNPAAYTSLNYVGFADVVSNSATFLLAADSTGHDYATVVSGTPLTASASVPEATVVHLLTASYGGSGYHLTVSGTGGALEDFAAIAVGDVCDSGSIVNTAAMQNGSATDNVFDQTAVEVRDTGGCQTGNSGTGPNYSYYLYEQTFLLNSSFANQSLTSIVLSNNTNSAIQVLGITLESAAGPFFTSSSDNTGQLVIGQASQTITWANPTASNVGPIGFSANSQTVTVSATVTAAATVNSGTVSFSLLGNGATAPVINGSASASITVPGGTSPGSYPITATYTPISGSSTSYYLTDFPKDNNIYTNLNQQYPNTGAGTPGSGVGVANGGYFFNPSTYTSANSVAGADVATNGGSFVLSADVGGHDFEQISNIPPTLVTNIAQATAVHLLTAAYSGTNYAITITGDGGAVEVFNNITAPDFCEGGGFQINTSAMQNGSTTNNVFDQTVLYIFRDVGACASSTGSSATGDYTAYLLYEQTFLLSSSFANQNVISISVGNNTNDDLLLLGVSVDGTLNSSTDSRHNLVVGQGTPAITWSNPADLTAGTALGATQLNATANVAGTFVYTPPAGTVLGVGNQQTLSVSFIPTDTVDYTTATATVSINVDAAPLSTVTTASNVGPIVYSPNSQSITLTATVTSSSTVTGGTVSFTLLGSTVTAAVTNGSASISVPVPGGTTVGSYTIQTTYNPSASFTSSSDSAHQLTIGKATPAITWANPASIVAGTALGSTQLDATASVPGTFLYSPPAGTVLSAGNQQTLGVTFTPTDATDYTTATATASINVNSAGTVTTASNVGPIVYSPNSQSITLTATVTSSSTVTGGTVSFTLLGSTISAAVGNGSASASFTVSAGTTVGSYTIQATYNPSAGFTGSSDSAHQLSISKATPAITWANPANITVGTALGSTQLDATANTAGSFVYTPAAGTVLAVGNQQTLGVTFTPTDSTDYTTATATASINVIAAATVTTATNVGPIVYKPTASQSITLTATVTSSSTVTGGTVSFTLLGTTVSASVSNGTSSTSFTVPAGTAAGSDTIQATYNPATGFAGSSDSSHQLTISKATPIISWENPANITAGTALGASQLNASASVPGTFAYNPPSGTVLSAGTHQALGVTFTPNDGTDYATATDTVFITVNPALAPTTTSVQPAQVSTTYNPNDQVLLLVATVTSSSVVNSGTMTFSFASYSCTVPVGNGSAGTLASCHIPGGLAAGTYTILATYNPGAGYGGSSGTTTLTVAKATPGITWTSPASIPFGTALSATQLNATSSVPGTFTYNPAAGTVLSSGTETLSVTFTPSDTTDYSAVSSSVTLVVVAPVLHMTVAPLSLATAPCGPPCQSGPEYIVNGQWQLINDGTVPITNLQVTGAKLTTSSGTANGLFLPIALANLPAGYEIPFVNEQFVADVRTAGTTAVLTVSGTYNGGSFTSTSRWTMPPLPVYTPPGEE